MRHRNRRLQAESRVAAGSRFKDARLACCLSAAEVGKLFRVTERTVRNWEAGRVRIPYTAFKLLRILRGGELPGRAWRGFHVRGDAIWTPEGRPLYAADLGWWSLTVRMAHEFRRLVAERRAERTAAGEAGAGQPAGLVHYSTSRTCPTPDFSPEAENKGFAGDRPRPVVDPCTLREVA